MRVTLVHNPGAGDTDLSAETLRERVVEAGHEVSYFPLTEPGWEEALAEPGDLLVVAGGDGSVGKVLREIATNDVVVTLVPAGSANNVAGALGISPDAKLSRLIEGWANGDVRPLDVGIATAPWGEARFLESFGGGMFGEVLAQADGIEVEVDGDEKIDLGLELLRDVVDGLEEREWRIDADGVDLSGDFLAVEIMNLGQMGPNLPLAPGADPGDGLFDVVRIRDGDRIRLVSYLSERLRDLEPEPPSFTGHTASRVELRAPPGVRLHVDDRFWSAASGARGDGAAVVTKGPALSVLVPKP